MGDDDGEYPPTFLHKNNTYNLNNKVMVTAIVSLSAVIILVTALHIYARCVLRRQDRRRSILRQLRFTIAQPPQPDPTKTGLDPLVIAALPTFIFKQPVSVAGAGAGEDAGNTECAICLSFLEDDDVARLLPNCQHSFHVDCIDTWLSLHSNCPVCRTEAEPRPVPEPREMPAAARPTAPPVDGEGTSDGDGGRKLGGSTSTSSRLSSFRKMISRERSSRRIQSCGEDEGLGQDLERQ